MATLLPNSIKFKSLADQLSKQEFLLFINKLFDINKIDLITTSLFTHLTTSSSANDENINNNNLNNINNIISNIIQSRKTKPKRLSTTNIKLDQLPQPIIGHTASFLDQYDYFEFERLNRWIFIGCNAPNMLQTLDLGDDGDYCPINLRKFRSLRKLKINIHKFKDFALPNDGQYIMNELDELLLDAKEANDCDIEPFMNENCVNIENIKTLKLHDFGIQFNADKLWRILTKFSNIEYLELSGIYVIDIDANKLKELYPKLKGLSINGGRYSINKQLIETFGNDLTFLRKTTLRHIDLKKNDFNKLEQIGISNPDINAVNDILKTARNLQKMWIRPFKQNEDELKTVIPAILKCKSLEYFEIVTNNDVHCAAILEGIEIGLYKTNNLKRRQLKLCVNGATMNSRIGIDDVIFKIGRIISRLESSNIKDFMFILDLNDIDTKEFDEQLNADDIFNDLKCISSNIEVKVDELCFVLTNKECKINGWDEYWTMMAF